MNKIKLFLKKFRFMGISLLGLFTLVGGCYLLNNNSYAWFVNEDNNLQSSNLFDKDSYNYHIGYSFDYTGSDWVNVGSIIVKPNTTYSCNKTINRISYDGSTTITLDGQTFTTPSGCYSIHIFRYLGGTQTEETARTYYSDCMLNVGSIALPYEPYGKVYYNYQFLSPWIVNEQGNLESTNLFNAPSTEIINDTENNTQVGFQFYVGTSEVYNVGNFFTTNEPAYIYYNVFRNLEVGKTYTLSISNYPYFYYEVWLDENNYYKTNNGVLTLTLTEDLKNYDDWRFVISENTPAIFASFTIMINEGTIPFAYAPYGKVYFSNNQAANLQSQLDTLQDKYTLLETNYNQLSSDFDNMHEDLEIANQENNDYLDTIHQLNDDVSSLQQLVTTLRSQVEDNFTWQNLFFTMADTPFRVVANALGFDVFGINLFATFIGLTTTLAIIFLIKKFI